MTDRGDRERAPAWYDDDSFWSAYEPFVFSPQKRRAAAAEVTAVCQLLDVEPGAHLLDLCCGVGRHALVACVLGYRVTGVDRTTAFLARARADADALGIDADALELVEADVRAFRRDRAFDGALNLYTSFGYFEDPRDDLRVAENLRSALRPGGRLVIDVLGKEVLARDFRERAWHEQDGMLLLEERELLDGFSAVRTRWTMIDADDRRHEHSYTLRIYAASELRSLLLEAGFARVSCHGDLSGDPYDQDAERLVAVAVAGD